MNPRILISFTCLFLLAADWPQHPQNEWIKQSPTAKQPAPQFGWEGSGAYDPFSKKWIHFGGHDGIPQGFHLFTYDLESRLWEQRFPNTSPPGVCCIDGANTFDIANRRFVNFPGGSLGHGYQWSRGVKLKRSPVWLYDPEENTWTDMRPPPYQRPFAREDNVGGLDAGAAYSSRHEISISFGGQGSQGGTSNLHFYDAYANKLTRIIAAGAPSPRDGMGICVDEKNDCIVVFGSQYASDEKTHLYRFATGKWEAHDLKPRPNAKKGKTYSTIPRLAYDSLNEICLGLIWDDATGNHESWTLDVAKLQWTKMDAKTEPDKSMSRSRNMSYSPEHNAFLLDLNPAAQKGKGVQMWTYRLKNVPVPEHITPPTQVEAVTEEKRVLVRWSEVPGADQYQVHRADGTESWRLTFKKIADVRGLALFDADVTPGKTYFYTVRAVDGGGQASVASQRVRSEPRVLLKPVVSVLAADKIEVNWNAHPAKDIAGYNLYRGNVKIRTVKKGNGTAWKDNDPEYDEPTIVEVENITNLKKLNDKLITETSYADFVDLTTNTSKDYKFAVHAYVVRAVNKFGVESGPSPYALTIPSEPTHVLLREAGNAADLKWSANPEKGIAGYRVYKLDGTWGIRRVTEEPIKTTTFTHKSGQTRYWVVAVDALGQEGQPSSPVWHQHSYRGFFKGEWHQ